MIVYLILSILCSALLGVVFKLFPKYKIDTFQAIVVNYNVCVLTGMLTSGYVPFSDQFWTHNWFVPALILGAIFISCFYILGLTVQHFGITITSVTQKMSLVISVPFAIVMFSESYNLIKLLAIVLAMLAVIFINLPNKSSSQKQSGTSNLLLWSLPLITFVSSGVIEAYLQYVEVALLKGAPRDPFVIFLFGTAGVLGIFTILINFLLSRKAFQAKSIIAGIILGIPNYGSIYFLLKVLSKWDGSIVYPVNNVGIILLSALIAFVYFKEKLSRVNILGVVLAILSIVLISLF